MHEKSQWKVYRTRFLVRACQLTEPLTFTDSLGRQHSGAAGDYLVETYSGILRITLQQLFKDIYVPLANAPLTSPTATVSNARGMLGRPAVHSSTKDHLRATA
jgi:hypothetical protein